MNQEAERERKITVTSIKSAVLMFYVLAYILGYIVYLKGEDSIWYGIGLIPLELGKLHIWYPLVSSSLLAFMLAAGISVVIGYLFYLDLGSRKHFDSDTAKGSARFMSEEEIEEYNMRELAKTPEDIETYKKEYLSPCDEGITRGDESYNPADFDLMIMSKNFRRHIISDHHIGDNNILIVGGSGSGKTYNHISPNLAQMNCSCIVTDTDGGLLKTFGKAYAEHGYKVKVFSSNDMSASNAYNPFHYVNVSNVAAELDEVESGDRKKEDKSSILTLVDCFITNTTDPNASSGDEFFTKSERMLYSALISYLKEFCPDEELHNFSSILKMILSFTNSEDPSQKDNTSEIEKIMMSLPKDSLTYQNYIGYTLAPPKTRMSILISAVVRIAPFMIDEVKNVTETDQLELDRFGFEKIVLFMVPNSRSTTFNFLNALVYSQFFEVSYRIGNDRNDKFGSPRLPVPVRCYLDEFSNVGRIPNISARLSDMRKYGIGCTIILQDLSQIQLKNYEKDWREMVGNCRTIIFLAGSDPETLKYFSDKLGNQTITVEQNSIQGANVIGENKTSASLSLDSRALKSIDELATMDKKYCIVYTVGMNPLLDEKYNLSDHPRYNQLGTKEHPENNYKVREIAQYNSAYRKYMRTMARATHEMNLESLDTDIFKLTGTGKIKDVSELKTSENVYEANDGIHVQEEVEEEAYDSCFNRCMEAAIHNLNENVIVMKMENIPQKHLKDMAMQVSIMTGISKVVLFTFIEQDKDDYDIEIVGVSVDRTPEHKLTEVLDRRKNNYIKAVEVMDGEETTKLTVSYRSYDDFKKQLLSTVA